MRIESGFVYIQLMLWSSMTIFSIINLTETAAVYEIKAWNQSTDNNGKEYLLSNKLLKSYNLQLGGKLAFNAESKKNMGFFKKDPEVSEALIFPSSLNRSEPGHVNMDAPDNLSDMNRFHEDKSVAPVSVLEYGSTTNSTNFNNIFPGDSQTVYQNLRSLSSPDLYSVLNNNKATELFSMGLEGVAQKHINLQNVFPGYSQTIYQKLRSLSSPDLHSFYSNYNKAGNLLSSRLEGVVRNHINWVNIFPGESQVVYQKLRSLSLPHLHRIFNNNKAAEIFLTGIGLVSENPINNQFKNIYMKSNEVLKPNLVELLNNPDNKKFGNIPAMESFSDGMIPKLLYRRNVYTNIENDSKEKYQNEYSAGNETDETTATTTPSTVMGNREEKMSLIFSSRSRPLLKSSLHFIAPSYANGFGDKEYKNDKTELGPDRFRGYLIHQSLGDDADSEERNAILTSERRRKGKLDQEKDIVSHFKSGEGILAIDDENERDVNKKHEELVNEGDVSADKTVLGENVFLQQEKDVHKSAMSETRDDFMFQESDSDRNIWENVGKNRNDMNDRISVEVEKAYFKKMSQDRGEERMHSFDESTKEHKWAVEPKYENRPKKQVIKSVDNYSNSFPNSLEKKHVKNNFEEEFKKEFLYPSETQKITDYRVENNPYSERLKHSNALKKENIYNLYFKGNKDNETDHSADIRNNGDKENDLVGEENKLDNLLQIHSKELTQDLTEKRLERPVKEDRASRFGSIQEDISNSLRELSRNHEQLSKFRSVDEIKETDKLGDNKTGIIYDNKIMPSTEVTNDLRKKVVTESKQIGKERFSSDSNKTMDIRKETEYYEDDEYFREEFDEDYGNASDLDDEYYVTDYDEDYYEEYGQLHEGDKEYGGDKEYESDKEYNGDKEYEPSKYDEGDKEYEGDAEYDGFYENGSGYINKTDEYEIYKYEKDVIDYGNNTSNYAIMGGEYYGKVKGIPHSNGGYSEQNKKKSTRQHITDGISLESLNKTKQMEYKNDSINEYYEDFHVYLEPEGRVEYFIVDDIEDNEETSSEESDIGWRGKNFNKPVSYFSKRTLSNDTKKGNNNENDMDSKLIRENDQVKYINNVNKSMSTNKNVGSSNARGVLTVSSAQKIKKEVDKDINGSFAAVYNYRHERDEGKTDYRYKIYGYNYIIVALEEFLRKVIEKLKFLQNSNATFDTDKQEDTLGEVNSDYRREKSSRQTKTFGSKTKIQKENGSKLKDNYTNPEYIIERDMSKITRTGANQNTQIWRKTTNDSSFLNNENKHFENYSTNSANYSGKRKDMYMEGSSLKITKTLPRYKKGNLIHAEKGVNINQDLKITKLIGENQLWKVIEGKIVDRGMNNDTTLSEVIGDRKTVFKKPNNDSSQVDQTINIAIQRLKSGEEKSDDSPDEMEYLKGKIIPLFGSLNYAAKSRVREKHTSHNKTAGHVTNAIYKMVNNSDESPLYAVNRDLRVRYTFQKTNVGNKNTEKNERVVEDQEKSGKHFKKETDILHDLKSYYKTNLKVGNIKSETNQSYPFRGQGQRNITSQASIYPKEREEYLTLNSTTVSQIFPTSKPGGTTRETFLSNVFPGSVIEQASSTKRFIEKIGNIPSQMSHGENNVISKKTYEIDGKNKKSEGHIQNNLVQNIRLGSRQELQLSQFDNGREFNFNRNFTNTDNRKQKLDIGKENGVSKGTLPRVKNSFSNVKRTNKLGVKQPRNGISAIKSIYEGSEKGKRNNSFKQRSSYLDKNNHPSEVILDNDIKNEDLNEISSVLLKEVDAPLKISFHIDTPINKIAVNGIRTFLKTKLFQSGIYGMTKSDSPCCEYWTRLSRISYITKQRKLTESMRKCFCRKCVKFGKILEVISKPVLFTDDRTYKRTPVALTYNDKLWSHFAPLALFCIKQNNEV